jgi:poly-beta-1,6-N-acetyl-D-glucosamine biosynthesis protein PgaD
MNGASRSWPPLIIARHVPRLVKWRDVLLTLIAWCLFAALLSAELGHILGVSLERLGFGPFDRDSDRPTYLEQVMPFFLAAAALAVMLVTASVLTLRRRRHSLLIPQPEPLETADQARGAGLDEATLVAARDEKVVTVHIDSDGSYRIEAPPG